MKKLIFLTLLVASLFGQSYVPLPTNIQIKNIPAFTNNALSWMNSHKMTNPMTAKGDLVVGDTGGIPIRLGASVGYLYWNGTNYVWNTPSNSGAPAATPIGPNIQSITFPKLNWTTLDGFIQFSLTFDKSVSWTGTPGIYLSVGNLTAIAYSNTQSPAQTLVFNIYPPTVTGTASPAFGIYQLSWGNRATYASYQTTFTADTGSYGTASVLFTAQNNGIAGNDIRVSIGNIIQYGFNGATVVPNTPLSITVSGNDITIIGATDGSGNEITTGADLIAAYNASTEMQALVNMQVTMGDTSKPIEFTNQFAYCASGTCNPTFVNLNSGYDSHDGTQIDSVPGYTVPTFTFTDASGSPDVTFNGPDTSMVTYQTIVTSFAQFYGDVYPQAGTSGSDFNITSNQVVNSSQLFFNLPTASATKRGALSSSDWSRFDAATRASSPSGTDDQLLGFPGGTAAAVTPIFLGAPIPVYLPSARFVQVEQHNIAGNATIGNYVDVYTCPTQSPRIRCAVMDVFFMYGKILSNGSQSCGTALKDNSDNYHLLSSSSLNPPAVTTFPGIILEQGEKLATFCGTTASTTLNKLAEILGTTSEYLNGNSDIRSNKESA